MRIPGSVPGILGRSGRHPGRKRSNKNRSHNVNPGCIGLKVGLGFCCDFCWCLVFVLLNLGDILDLWPYKDRPNLGITWHFPFPNT